ncbi:MAG: hypothetical protein ACK4UO_00575 [Pseudolabrys sp.]
MTNWPESMQEMKGHMRTLRSGTPDVIKASPESRRPRSRLGREEVVETLGMAIYMGAGPAVMYAGHAIDAFDQFAQTASRPVAPAAAAQG